MVLGNHDSQDIDQNYPHAGGNGYYHDKDAWLALVQEDGRAPDNAYQNGDDAYYSFSTGGYHFILLETIHPEDPNNFSYQYPQDELDWLER